MATTYFSKDYLNRKSNHTDHVLVKMATVYWSKEEMLKLISIWSNGMIQVQLEGCKRNIDIYRRIANELTEAGYN